jgi:hypothetical protein
LRFLAGLAAMLLECCRPCHTHVLASAIHLTAVCANVAACSGTCLNISHAVLHPTCKNVVGLMDPPVSGVTPGECKWSSAPFTAIHRGRVLHSITSCKRTVLFQFHVVSGHSQWSSDSRASNTRYLTVGRKAGKL